MEVLQNALFATVLPLVDNCSKFEHGAVMAQPTEKHPAIEGFLEETFGRTTAIEGNTCVFCHKEATEFRNEISRKEYKISGICQACQDDTFGVD